MSPFNTIFAFIGGATLAIAVAATTHEPCYQVLPESFDVIVEATTTDNRTQSFVIDIPSRSFLLLEHKSTGHCIVLQEQYGEHIDVKTSGILKLIF